MCPGRESIEPADKMNPRFSFGGAADAASLLAAIRIIFPILYFPYQVSGCLINLCCFAMLPVVPCRLG